MANIGILIQGVFDRPISRKVIERVKLILPDLNIYYATQHYDDCFKDYGLNYIEILDPGISIFVKPVGFDYNNSLRLIENTQLALKFVKEEFVLKIRFDLLINNRDFLDYYFANNTILDSDCSFKFNIGVVRYIDYRFH